MSKAEQALAECHAAVKAYVKHLPLDDAELATFIDKFRRDFHDALAKEPNGWERDRVKVTTLARAIATFAEFLALSDPDLPGRVEYRHLKFAYELLSPFCRPVGVSPRRQYCTTAAP